MYNIKLNLLQIAQLLAGLELYKESFDSIGYAKEAMSNLVEEIYSQVAAQNDLQENLNEVS